MAYSGKHLFYYVSGITNSSANNKTSLCAATIVQQEIKAGINRHFGHSLSVKFHREARKHKKINLVFLSQYNLTCVYMGLKFLNELILKPFQLLTLRT